MKRYGFTIIELLIAMTVIVTITGIFIGGYNNFNATEKLRQSGKTLKTNLRYAQVSAMSVVLPNGCVNFNSYRVTFTAASYSIQAVCSGALTGKVTTINLPAEVTFSPVPAPLSYELLTGTTSGFNPPSTTLILVAGTKSYRILVTSAGDISDLGLQ